MFYFRFKAIESVCKIKSLVIEVLNGNFLIILFESFSLLLVWHIYLDCFSRFLDGPINRATYHLANVF